MSPFLARQFLAEEMRCHLAQLLCRLRITGNDLVGEHAEVKRHCVLFDQRPDLTRLGNAARSLLEVERCVAEASRRCRFGGPNSAGHDEQRRGEQNLIPKPDRMSKRAVHGTE